MVYLRKANKDDMELLYQWVNDPSVRASSFHTEPVPYETHKEWFSRMMDDDSTLQYILMDGNVPVGQIRLSINGEEGEIGYSITKDQRGKGYGSKILRLVGEEVRSEYPQIKSLIAKVKPDNEASRRAFIAGDYQEEYCFYRRALK